MIGPRPWDRSSRAALASVVAACALAVVSAGSAWRVEPLPQVVAPDSKFRVAEAPPPDSVVTAYAVLTATENNAFRPDRRRPRERYLPPSLRRAAAPIVARPPKIVPAFSLRGIAWTPGRPAVAILGVAGQPARLFKEGAEIEAFRVQSITERQVTLVGADTTVVLTLESRTSRERASINRGRTR
jgi:hypothetical protein